MGAGWELYGQPAGYTQQQWNRLSQAERDYVKATHPGAAHDYMQAHAAQNAEILNQPGVGWATQGYYPPQDQGPYDQGPQSYDDGSGSDSSGSGSGFTRQPLASSPEWLAYLNALGLEQGQFSADIDRQRAFAKAAADYQTAGLEPQFAQQRRGINGSLEARGMSNSGEKLRRLAESRASQGRAQSDIQLGLGSTLSNLESELAGKMMDLGARRAQQELQLRTQGYY